MRFVKTDNLKTGMRLAKPIYNRNGVMLYERDSRLTEQGINSIRNFGLLGVYILDNAEPVPPMSEFDIEFERFQTMAIFSLKDDLSVVLEKKNSRDLYRLANLILEGYGYLSDKVQFIQNLRSRQDYVYKHTLNVSILCALIAGAMKLTQREKLDVIVAGLIHDIGKLLLPKDVFQKVEEYTEEEKSLLAKCKEQAYESLLLDFDLSPNARIIVAQYNKVELGDKYNEGTLTGTRILAVADAFDCMTAMKVDEEPTSILTAVRYLVDHEEQYGKDIIEALLAALQILTPAVCVELSNGEKGLVLEENTEDIMRPMVLCFTDNKIYDLADDKVYRNLQVKDIMRTMDNRFVMDHFLLEQYNGVLTYKRKVRIGK